MNKTKKNALKKHRRSQKRMKERRSARKPKGIDRFLTPQEQADAQRAWAKGTTGPVET